MNHPRIRWAHFFIKAGVFIRSLIPAVLRPADLIEMSHRLYADPENIKSACDERYLSSGLCDYERDLFKWAPENGRNLLLLGVGSGREALALAAEGFIVTGVDFIPELIDHAAKRLARDGYRMTGWVQEISELSIPHDSFNVVWLSYNMYSVLPTSKRRTSMLRRIRCALKPGGVFFCQFLYDPSRAQQSGKFFIRKIIAWLTFGNFQLEQGDCMWNGIEYIHAFTSQKEIIREFAESGMTVRHIELNTKCDQRAYAVLFRE
ncbi:class I SAM-dependent methyltransferase [bacterium]|nr:class I SAM-dependent methyltransferase [bacterium]